MRLDNSGAYTMGMINDDLLDESYGEMMRMAENSKIGECWSLEPAVGQRTNGYDMYHQYYR